MRKLFYPFILFIFSVITSIAQENVGTNFEDLTFEEALLKAKAENKRLFVDCYTKSCTPCLYMIKNIFPLKECGDYFNPNYISIKKDMEVGDGVDIAKKFKVMILPTFLIFEPDGSLLCRIEGGAVRSPQDDFIGKFKNSIIYSEMDKVYKSGDYDEEFVDKFIDFLQINERMHLAKVLDEVMPSRGIKRLCEPENWKLIQDNVKKVESVLFRYLFDNREAFMDNLCRDDFRATIMNVYAEEFRNSVLMDLDYKTYIRDLRILEEEGYTKAGSLWKAVVIRQIIKDKESNRIEEILNIVEKEISDVGDDEEKITILSELSGFGRIASVEQCTRLKTSLQNIAATLSQSNSVKLNKIINQIMTELSRKSG